MNENEALELLAKHYYCPYDAILIGDRIINDYKEGDVKVSERVLTFECEQCGAKWAVIFHVDD